MHLSAAVGTPVVALFAPTVPPQRWRPWGVAHVLLGDLDIACRGCRARRCPWAEQHCLETVRPAAVLEALESLMAPVATATAARSSASHHALEACQ
jgi:ADP-heptose:LPS heptosyltransferase